MSNETNQFAEQSDEKLLADYISGNLAALETLISRHRQSLYNYIRKMTYSSHDADEIFQDVWMKVIQKSGLYKKGQFRGWVFRIAHNLVIDRVRTKKPDVSLDGWPNAKDGASFLNTCQSSTPSPSSIASVHETIDSIYNALDNLATEQREVFLMRMEIGLPFKEIAQIQKVSVNTALARMHYAIASLKKQLSNIEHERKPL